MSIDDSVMALDDLVLLCTQFLSKDRFMATLSPAPNKAAKDPSRIYRAAETLLSSMQGDVVLYGDPQYGAARQVWNKAVERRPAMLAYCESVADVQIALNTACKDEIPISVRSCGHDWVGRALRDEGLTIDLSRMRKVMADATDQTALLEGGATAGDLIDAASRHGLAAVTGMASEVGMTGLMLGGGYGPLTPRFGLALDNLLEAEVVLAHGRLVKASATENPDLFWALRGGGGNFGVVTSMRLRLFPVQDLLYGPILFPWSQAEQALNGFAELMISPPEELAATAGVLFDGKGLPMVFVSPAWSGEIAKGQEFVAQLEALGKPIVSKVAVTPYAGVIRAGDAVFERARYSYFQTRWLPAVSAGTIASIIESVNRCPSPLSLVTLQSFHGAPTRIDEAATAFGMRRRHFLAIIMSAWAPDAGDGGDPSRAWARNLSEGLTPESFPGGYPNLLGPEEEERSLAAYGANLARMREIKRQFDPAGVFSSAVPLPLA